MALLTSWETLPFAWEESALEFMEELEGIKFLRQLAKNLSQTLD
jgi:hypothetical protein